MSRTLLVVSAVFAVGMALPPIGWAVTYLMAFWFAGVGIWRENGRTRVVTDFYRP